jgi:hypothetical protein
MIYNCTDGQFSITIPGNKYSPGNMKEESDRRAVDIAATSDKILVSVSSGIDGQAMIHSFHTQGIPFETAFLYSPGFNDIEYDQLRVLISKYNLKPIIVELDPISLKDQVLYESDIHRIQRNQIYQKLFLEKLPGDYDFVQMSHDPFVYISSSNKWQYYQGYNGPEVSRDRAFKLVNRKGKCIFYGDTSEFLYSILADDIYSSALFSARYFDGNGLQKPGVLLGTVDRWDYYIKPLMYGKYWKDSLIYFPKYAGFENIPYLSEHSWFQENATLIPYSVMLENMKNGIDTTYNQNHHKVSQ